MKKFSTPSTVSKHTYKIRAISSVHYTIVSHSCVHLVQMAGAWTTKAAAEAAAWDVPQVAVIVVEPAAVVVPQPVADMSMSAFDAYIAHKPGALDAFLSSLEATPAIAKWRARDTGNSLLTLAVQYHIGRVDELVRVVSAFISAGADVNSRNKWNATALHWTTAPAVGKALITAGADVDAVDSRGWTPLCHAASRNTVPMGRELLRAGAAIDGCPKCGDTPLRIAVTDGNEAFVAMLLGWKGATPSLHTPHGIPLRTLAMRAGLSRIAEMFSAHKRQELLTVPASKRRGKAHKRRRLQS